MVNSYVCVDIETTGVQSKWDKIIEIGAIKVIDGKVIDTFSELINPGIPIPDYITKLTGINDEMVKNCDHIGQVIRRFVEFSEDYPLLGHNLRFDYAFLKQNAMNEGMEFERFGIDTLKIARKVHPELESRSLEFLCDYYAIRDENHHRAFNDADVTSKLYWKLNERFGDDFHELFEAHKFEMKIKKVSPITEKQVRYLTSLYRYHNMEMDFDIHSLSKNEASRKIDKILSEKGRILY